MTEFLDLLEVELRGAAERRWNQPPARRRSVRALAVAATLAAVIAIGAVVLLTGGDEHRASVPAGTPRTTYVDPARHFSVSYPATWARAPRRLTPALIDPLEIFSAGSAALLPRQGEHGCGQLPTRALAELGPGDALVSIQERQRLRRVANYPPRPARWDWSRTGRFRYALECVPRDVNARWIVFRDAGRAFYGLVAIGPGSTAADGRRAMSVLNSFRPQPR